MSPLCVYVCVCAREAKRKERKQRKQWILLRLKAGARVSAIRNSWGSLSRYLILPGARPRPDFTDKENKTPPLCFNVPRRQYEIYSRVLYRDGYLAESVNDSRSLQDTEAWPYLIIFNLERNDFRSRQVVSNVMEFSYENEFIVDGLSIRVA